MTETLKKCPRCEGKMDRYYGWWCPRCDKPKRETNPVLNIVKALMHVEAVSGNVGYYDRVWSHLCDAGNVRNDTTTGFSVEWDILDDPEDEQGLTEQEIADFRLLRDTFDITDDEGLQFEFSW